MDQCRVPIEVCERIIDLRTTYGGRSRISRCPRYLDDLRACALTCRDWLPRSRFNLFRCVRIRKHEKLKSLAKTITDHPFLAEFVRELYLGRLVDEELEPNDYSDAWLINLLESLDLEDDSAVYGASMKRCRDSANYLPFADEPLVGALHNVRIITLSSFDWHALHPMYHEVAARYPIVELNIVDGQFRALPDLLRVIWAFRGLQALNLVDVKLERESNVNLGNLLQERRPVCRELKKVTIVGVSESLYISRYIQLVLIVVHLCNGV